MSAAKGKTKREGLGSVLIVEDDAIVALGLEDALLAAGAASVMICTSTADALAALRDSKPDAMVLDVHLADRDDGWAIAELVNSVGPKPPRIVFATGSPEAIPEAIRELGPVLAKPYEYGALIAALSQPPSRSLLDRLRGR